MSSLSNQSINKLEELICCPECYGIIVKINSEYVCKNCSLYFPIFNNIPRILTDQNLLKRFRETTRNENSLKSRIKSKIKLPDERIWSLQSRKVLKQILNQINPDNNNTFVVNMGSGCESFYKKLFKHYKGIIRIGIPHEGEVNAFGDAMKMPIKSLSTDLLISSSVIEHLSNPEKAVEELNRIIKPEGLIYAEIPFIGAYHMASYDYQRYTISGIEKLFERHGFHLDNKGISSGPFTAFTLFIQNSLINLFPKGSIQYPLRVFLSWILMPIKYLDYLVENMTWSNYAACNFFYLGRK